MINPEVIWRTGEIPLPAIGRTIAIPLGARVEYRGPVDSPRWSSDLSLADSLGLCEGRYNFPTGFFEFTLVRKPHLPSLLDAFVSGHEEGHLLYYLGQLDQLREEARIQGYGFDFLSSEICRDLDGSARKVLGKVNNAYDFERVWKNSPASKEAFAHVAGLVALAKRGAPKDLLQRFYEDIQSHCLDVAVLVENEVDSEVDEILSRTQWL